MIFTGVLIRQRGQNQATRIRGGLGGLCCGIAGWRVLLFRLENAQGALSGALVPVCTLRVGRTGVLALVYYCLHEKRGLLMG